MFLGVDVSPDGSKQLIVTEVASYSPASKAGVRKGDLLLKADGHSMRDEEALLDVLRKHSPGDTVLLTVTRGDKTLDLSPTLRPLGRSAARPLGGEFAIDSEEIDVVRSHLSTREGVEY